MTVFSLGARAVRDAVARAARVSGPDGSTPIGAMRLRFAPGKLTASCSNYEISIDAYAHLDGTDSAELTVPARNFAAAVAAAPGEVIELETLGNGVMVRSGAMRVRVPTVEWQHGDDIFSWSEQIDVAAVDIPARDLAGVVALHSWTSSDSSRPGIACIKLDLVGSRITGYATDGHRLAGYVRDTGAVREHLSVLITAHAAAELASALGKNPAGNVALAVVGSSRRVAVRCGDCTMMFSQVEAAFPDVARVIPDRQPLTLTVDADALIAAMRRADSIAGRGDAAAMLSMRNDLAGTELTVTRKNELGIEAADTVIVTADGPLFGEKLGVNSKYMVAALELVQPGVRVGIRDAMSPMLVTGDGCYLAVIMPMRV